MVFYECKVLVSGAGTYTTETLRELYHAIGVPRIFAVKGGITCGVSDGLKSPHVEHFLCILS